VFKPEQIPGNHREYSIEVNIPPLGAIILKQSK